MAWTAPLTWVAGQLVTAGQLNTHIRDDLLILKTSIADDGDIDAGIGPHGIGGSALDYVQMLFSGTFVSGGASTSAVGTRTARTVTGANGDTAFIAGCSFEDQLTTQGNSETIAIAAQARFQGITITSGSDTVTESATVYVDAATAGATRNYALWVDAGDIRLDGRVGCGTGEATPTSQLEILTLGGSRIGLIVDTAASPSASCQEWHLNGSLRAKMQIGNNDAALVFSAFDNGSSIGPLVHVDRNSNGSTPSAGSLRMVDRGGTNYYLWPDDSGVWRIGTSAPSSANDTSGTVVGTQTSDWRAKEDIEHWDGSGATAEILRTQLYSYRFRDDSQRGDKLMRGLVIQDSDRGGRFSMNDHREDNMAVLDTASGIGHLFAAIGELHARIELLEAD